MSVQKRVVVSLAASGGWPESAEKSVWAGVNALTYWPLLFALSFLLKTKRAS